MPYYHILIESVSKITKETRRKAKCNLSEEYVRKAIAKPFMENEEFMFVGIRIDPDYVESIRIIETEKSLSEIADDELESERTIFDQMCEGNIGEQVTEEFIKLLPKKDAAKNKESSKPKSKNVFIVHGRNHEPMKDLRIMLLEFGLNPIVLHDKPSGSKTIVEKLEKYSDVEYAFVILTPDDVGGIFHGYKGKLLQFSKLALRARQNVVLEFGYFMGKLSRERVCCLYTGNIDLPSDMHGICYVHFDDSVNEVKDMILKELREAGYKLSNRS